MPRDSTAPRVILSGWYGAANLGDELLCAMLVRWVRGAGAVPVVLSVHPEYTAHWLQVDALGYTDLPRIVDAMAASGLFVLGGGGLFQDYDRFDGTGLDRFPAPGPAIFAQHFLLARDFRLHTLALAQGLGPLRSASARALVAEVLRTVDDVSLRDAASAALMREIGVGREPLVAPDPGWCFRVEPLLAGSLPARWPVLRERRVLAVVLRDWPFDPGWEDAFVAAFRDAVPADWGCLWLDFTRSPPDVEGGGHEVARRLIARLGEDRGTHVVWDGATVDEAAAVIAACDACVAMRLHGALLAHAAGLPTVAIEYDAKVTQLIADLGVPAAQRVPLAAIADRLGPALARVLGQSGATPFRLSAEARAGLAQGADAHRGLLASAIALARSGRERPCRRLSPDIARWLAAAGIAGEAASAAVRAGGDPG